jgi:hypothetical protein
MQVFNENVLVGGVGAPAARSEDEGGGGTVEIEDVRVTRERRSPNFELAYPEERVLECPQRRRTGSGARRLLHHRGIAPRPSGVSLQPRSDRPRAHTGKLVRSDLRGPVLRGADLRGANSSYADLKGANLAGAIVDGSTIWRHTICPDGTHSIDAGGSCVGHLSP